MSKAKKLLALALVAVFVLSVFPMTASAAGTPATTATVITANYWDGTAAQSVVFRTLDISAANSSALTIDTTITDHTIELPYGTTHTLTAYATTGAAATTTDWFVGSGAVTANSGLYKLATAAGSTTQVLGAANATLIAAGTIVSTQTVAVGDTLILFNGFTSTADDDVGEAGAEFKYAVFRVVTPAGGTITGDTSKKNPVYNVNIPTTLAYAIDPLQIGGAVGSSQFTGGDFAVANASLYPVKVTVELEVAGNALAGLKDSAWVPTDASGAGKNFNLALIGAAANDNSATFADPKGGTTFTDTAAYKRWFDTTSKEAKIELLLAKGVGADVSGTSSHNVSAFTIYGKLETYATWATTDITLTGTYTLTGIKDNDYLIPTAADTSDTTRRDDPVTKDTDESVGAAYDTPTVGYAAWNGGFKGTVSRADAVEVVGLNVLPDAPAIPGFLVGTGLSNINNTAKTATFTYVGANASTALIPFEFAGETVTKVMVNIGAWWDTNASAFTKQSGGLKIDPAYTAQQGFLLYFTLSSGDEWTVTVTAT